MQVEYHTPNHQELADAIRNAFRFLTTDYGFAEVDRRPESCPNPYSVLYRKHRMEILVEGHSYGLGTAIEFRVRRGLLGWKQDSFHLGWLTLIRRPDLLAPEFPDKRGQLMQLPKLASQLRAVADDLLRGDLSILPQIRAGISKARCEATKNETQEEFLRAEARSQEAFRHQDYASVVSVLGPHRHLLNASSRKRLELAEHRLRDVT